MKLNQKGITLIELIAALALVSIIAAGAWTTLTIGLKHSAVETNKTMMQQDANLIITTISAAHRQTEQYNLKIENGFLLIEKCPTLSTCSSYEQVIDREYDFSGSTINGVSLSGTPLDPAIQPKKFHANLKLQITSKSNSPPIIINTSLTRILTSRN